MLFAACAYCFVRCSTVVRHEPQYLRSRAGPLHRSHTPSSDQRLKASPASPTCAKVGIHTSGSRTLNAVAETLYGKCGDLSLAYQLFGDGPVELVFAGPFISHIELLWTVPEFKAFFDQLARSVAS